MLPIDRPPLITVFGGAGFIGRYVCENLLRRGARIIVAQRDLRTAHVVQPLAQVGQVGFRQADVTHPASIAHAVEGADAVINLVGAFRNMARVHAEGAAAVAETAARAGAGSFVQVSAIGADAQSPSVYGRTKAEGEARVRAAYPKATIIRPSLVFGPDDTLTNRFAALGRFPLVPVLASGTRFQPIYVTDLADAIAAASISPGAHGGKTYELGGPEVMTMIELHRAIFAITGQDPDLIELPDFAGDLLSRFGFLPGAPLTRDQWRMLQRDNVAAKGSLGLRAFGIEPTPLAAVGPEWLSRYRPGGRFAGRRAPLAKAG